MLTPQQQIQAARKTINAIGYQISTAAHTSNATQLQAHTAELHRAITALAIAEDRHNHQPTHTTPTDTRYGNVTPTDAFPQPIGA